MLSAPAVSSRSPTLQAGAISGTRPAADTRLGSSDVAEATGGVRKSCAGEVPFLSQEGTSPFPAHHARALHRWTEV